ncbi:type Z 30S ribosomal protein S14 [Candidatus Uhrbacteria bacterium]|nr:type Z 30S ribosomal protein S14 [Candidatus Uhrbacteria bacterium]
MSTKARVARAARKPKFTTRTVRLCWRCGRNRGVIRFFKMCRICVRELATQGALPGVRKSSW